MFFFLFFLLYLTILPLPKADTLFYHLYVFVMSMNTGGKQAEIIKSTINTIVEKIEIKREIEVMVAEKKFEAKVMNVMPFLIMAGLSLSAGDYMDPLFTGIIGRVVITVVLLLLGIAYMVSQKIMRIEV